MINGQGGIVAEFLSLITQTSNHRVYRYQGRWYEYHYIQYMYDCAYIYTKSKNGISLHKILVFGDLWNERRRVKSGMGTLTGIQQSRTWYWGTCHAILRDLSCRSEGHRTQW